MRQARWPVALLATLGGLMVAATQFSPWPSALLSRRALDRRAALAAQAIQKHVPAAGVSSILGERYGDTDEHALLDVFTPANLSGGLTTVVWLHGGEFIAGRKDHAAGYLQILASRGFTTVGVDFSVAPGRRFPEPLKEVAEALAYLKTNASRLRIDPAKLVLAGSSSGALLAAQLANAAVQPSYATLLGLSSSPPPAIAGVVLFGGLYDVGTLDMQGSFRRTVENGLWAYTGVSRLGGTSMAEKLSVVRHLTPAFPPAFVSSGNAADPVLSQSKRFMNAAGRAGIEVDALFFPDDQGPPVPHEFQFNLDEEAGRVALERAAAFLAKR